MPFRNEVVHLCNEFKIKSMQIENSEIKKVVTGNGLVDGQHEVICMTVITGSDTMRFMLPKCMGSESDIFDTFGDKISQYKKDGYEIDYRFKNEPLEINSVKS